MKSKPCPVGFRRVIQEQKWQFLLIFHLDLHQIIGVSFQQLICANLNPTSSSPFRLSSLWGMDDQISEIFFANAIVQNSRLWWIMDHRELFDWCWKIGQLCRTPVLTGFLQNYTIKGSSASRCPFSQRKKMIYEGRKMVIGASALNNNFSP